MDESDGFTYAQVVNNVFEGQKTIVKVFQEGGLSRKIIFNNNNVCTVESEETSLSTVYFNCTWITVIGNNIDDQKSTGKTKLSISADVLHKAVSFIGNITGHSVSPDKSAGNSIQVANNVLLLETTP